MWKLDEDFSALIKYELDFLNHWYDKMQITSSLHVALKKRFSFIITL